MARQRCDMRAGTGIRLSTQDGIVLMFKQTTVL